MSAKMHAFQGPVSGEPENEVTREARRERINAIKAELRTLCPGGFSEQEDEDYTPISEIFWQRVLDYEKRPKTTYYDLLIAKGVRIPDPKLLTDRQLPRKLKQVVKAMAKHKIFISQTDHLSDRELYHHLYHDVLRESDCDPGGGWTTVFNLLSDGTEASMKTYLTYYGDDDEREDWEEAFPAEPLPPKRKPRYNRDKDLPKPSGW